MQILRIAITLLLAAAVAPVAAQPGSAAAGAYVRKPLFVIEEYHLVLPGKRQAVIDYYRKMVMPVLRSYPGYIGWSILDPNPQASRFGDPAIASFATLPADPVVPHEGVMLDGAVRTDRQIHFHSMLRNGFNLIFHHYIADEATFRALIGHDSASGGMQDSLAARWKKMYGTDIWDVLAKDYFVNMRNHYDVVYTYESVE